MKTKSTYSSREAAAISGLSVYMVDYLARSKIIEPSIRLRPGRGKKRLYAFGDLVALKVAAAILQAGISVAKLRKSLATLQKKYGRKLRTTPSSFFCSDGDTVYFRDADGVVADLTKGGQMSFLFVLDLRSIHDETAEAIKLQEAI